MDYASTTTLKRIIAASPCEGGWGELLSYLGKKAADDEPLPLLTVLDICGLDDALWVLSRAMPDDRLARHFHAWCAEQELPIFEKERPNDTRVRNQISMLRNDNATDQDRTTARDAARVAARAARPPARYAGHAAASTSAWDATLDVSLGAQEAQLRKMLRAKD